MQIFQNLDEKTFLYNNRKYVKNFLLMKIGETHIAVYNAYDTKLQLLPSTHYSDVQVNGIHYQSQEDLMEVLSPILFVKSVENEPVIPSWGTITGQLSNQLDLSTALAGKFNNPSGTTAQYIRGNGTLATLPAAAVWGNITGPMSAQTDLNTSLLGKLNKGNNIEFERLADVSDIYSPALFSRTGSVYRSNSFRWDEGLKKLTIKGTQAIWEASSEVTDGNMGIKALSGASESFKVYDNFGNFISTGTVGGKKLTRIFTPLRLTTGSYHNETEYRAIECPASNLTPLKWFTIPNNSILTIDALNISACNTDKNSIIGYAQFSFKNDNGVVTEISRPELKYERQYSYIKATPGYVTSTDTRIDTSVSGPIVTLGFINTSSKVTNVYCEVKHNISYAPEL